MRSSFWIVLRVEWTDLELDLTPNDGVLIHNDPEFEKLTWLLQQKKLPDTTTKDRKRGTAFRDSTTTFIVAGVYYCTTV